MLSVSALSSAFSLSLLNFLWTVISKGAFAGRDNNLDSSRCPQAIDLAEGSVFNELSLKPCTVYHSLQKKMDL